MCDIIFIGDSLVSQYINITGKNLALIFSPLSFFATHSSPVNKFLNFNTIAQLGILNVLSPTAISTGKQASQVR